MVEGSGQGWSHWHSWSQAVCGRAPLLSWYYFELWCVVSAFGPALITTQSHLLRVEWVLQERKLLKRFSSNIEASSFWESYFKGNSGGKSRSSRFKAKEESRGEGMYVVVMGTGVAVGHRQGGGSSCKVVPAAPGLRANPGSTPACHSG